MSDNETLHAEIQRLNIQCEGLFASASNNGQALILAESRIQQLTQALRDAQSMLLWCERRMMSPSIATYPKACAERIERIITLRVMTTVNCVEHAPTAQKNVF